MAIQKINLGTEPHGVGGDSYRTANDKINKNFEEVSANITNVDEKYSNTEVKITEEVARAKQVEDELKTDLEKEVSRAVSAEADILGVVESESKARATENIRINEAQTQLKSLVDSEVEKLKLEDTSIKTGLEKTHRYAVMSQTLGLDSKFYDKDGQPLSGGKVYTYEAGTSTLSDTYKDVEFSTPNTNPIILDETGSADIFLKGTYRFRIFDKNETFVEEQEGINQPTSLASLNELSKSVESYKQEVNSSLEYLKEKTLVVESIADLSTINNPKDGLRVYVKSYHAGLGKGGGYFTYDSSKSAVNDGGAVINGWVRDKKDIHTIYDFGYIDSQSASEQTSLLKKAIESQYTVSIDLQRQTIKLANASSIVATKKTLINGFLKATEDLNSTPIVLTNGTVFDVEFDGSNRKIGGEFTEFGQAYAPFLMLGDYAVFENSTVKNLKGTSYEQYGVIVDGFTPSSFINSTFKQITNVTQENGGGGFCGGIFIYATKPSRARAVTHKVDRCNFSDIYSLKNSRNVVTSDSDGVRVYFNDIGLNNAVLEEAVKQSILTVENCIFKNILKSAAKIQNLRGVFRNNIVVVDDLKDQGQQWVYGGVRYQGGESFTVDNCRISGQLRYGVISFAGKCEINNCDINQAPHPASNVKQNSLMLGTLADLLGIYKISNLYANKPIASEGAKNVSIDHSEINGVVVGKTGELRLSNSSVSGEITTLEYEGYPDLYLEELYIDNCKTSTDRYFLSLKTVRDIQRISIKQSQITLASSFLESSSIDVKEIDINNTKLIATNSFNNSAIFKGSIKNVSIKDCDIAFTRNDIDLLLFSTGNSDNLGYSLVVENTQIKLGDRISLVFYTRSYSDVKFNNVDFKGGASGLNLTEARNGTLRLQNVSSTASNTQVVFQSTDPSNANVYVNGAYGKLKTPFVLNSGTNEYSSNIQINVNSTQS